MEQGYLNGRRKKMTREPEVNQLQAATEEVRKGSELCCFIIWKESKQIQRRGSGCLQCAQVSVPNLRLPEEGCKDTVGGGLSHPGF